jgi:hypothetical protein
MFKPIVAGVLAACLPLFASAGPTTNPSTPFRIGIELPTQVPVTAAVENSLKDMGIDFVNYYAFVDGGANSLDAAKVNTAMLELCDRLKIDDALSTHHYDPPDAVVKQSAAHANGAHFLGVIFDEVEHIRLLCADVYHTPLHLADNSKCDTFEEAYENTLAGYQKLKAKFDQLGAPRVVATHIWPVMLPIAARAGFVPCPKICKELYSPVTMSQGIGAALEYNRELWVDCDLWYWAAVPGHPPEEMRSNLLLAYWLGADAVYIEGAGFNLLPAGHQGIPFSLMTQMNDDHYQLTPHGEVLRWFCREYVPHHPRAWTFRDIRPSIAMIRFEDTDYGQRLTGPTKNLYDCPNLHSTRDTEAWFGAWNLLTHGTTGTDGLTAFKPSFAVAENETLGREPGFFPNYLTLPKTTWRHTFFAPMNGAVVFDHLVGYDRLKDIPLLILTGVDVSDETMLAIHRCVSEGARCLAWGPLASKHGFEAWTSGTQIVNEGKGRFILTDDFDSPAVQAETKSLIGKPEEIRYRFADHDVVLRRVDANQVHVLVDGHDPVAIP